MQALLKNSLYWILILAVLIGSVSAADVPQTINIQGMLRDADREIVPDGSYAVTFSIYDAENGGSPLWTSLRTIAVTEGLFSVNLGSETAFPADLFDQTDLWLGLQVESDPEMLPRQHLTSVPYAIRSQDEAAAGTITSVFGFEGLEGGGDSGDIVLLIADGGVTGNKLASGAVTEDKLADNSITSSQIAAGSILFSDMSQNGAAVGQVMKWNGSAWSAMDDLEGGGAWTWSDSSSYGPDSVLYAAQTSMALYSDSAGAVADGSIDADDLADNSITSSQIAAGSILFSDMSQNGASVGQVMKWNGSAWSAMDDLEGSGGGWVDDGSVIRLATITDDVGIGTNSPDVPLHIAAGGDVHETGGGHLLIGSATGSGIRIDGNEIQAYNSGTATGATLYLQNEGTGSLSIAGNTFLAGAAVGHEARLTSYRSEGGVTYWGFIGDKYMTSIVDPDCPAGIYEHVGIMGHINSNNSCARKIGVFGYAGGNGVNNTKIGIYGAASGSGINWAGYFDGNINVTGTVQKSSGIVQIDHPQDPANKYLVHAQVESPEMISVYNGNVSLDSNGEAIVEMPDYCESLNADFRYQLTSIGAPGPNLHIAREIENGQFKIAGGQPGAKVSWEITGLRQDAYASAHKITNEISKPDGQQGLYLHPIEHGQPESMGIGYKDHSVVSAKMHQTEESR